MLINDNFKFLENIKQGFKRTVSRNKYRSEVTTQPKTNKLDYLIDPAFKSIKRLIVLSLKRDNDDPTKWTCSIIMTTSNKYYMSFVEIKDLNTFVDNKSFFDHPVWNK